MMTYRDGPEDIDRAIRRLERWHRDWEIRNRERLVEPMFATWDEVTHEHEWTKQNSPARNGNWYDQCDHCHIIRKHVEGTWGLTAKLELAMREETAKLLADLERF